MGQFLKEKNVKRDMSWKLSVLRKEKLQPFSSLGLYPGGGGVVLDISLVVGGAAWPLVP